MKKILVLLFGILPYVAHAQLEIYGRYTAAGSIEPNINYAASRKITKKISLTFFGLVEQKWNEALVGASYAPSKSLSLAASIGIEYGTNSPRFGASIWKEKGNTTLLILGELGGGKNNYLYKVNLFHKYTDHFTMGATAWRFHGIGPNLRYSIPKLQSTIWLMPAYDFETDKSKVIVGLSLNMGK